MNNETDAIACLLIVAAMVVIEAVQILFTVFDRGIYKDPREMLVKKTNKELRNMLKGVKRVNSMNKEQLVEMVLLNAE